MQLRRAGLPLLIEDYSAAEDIFTRALPFLSIVAVLEVLGAMNFDWSWGLNLAALGGGAVLLLLLYGLFNRLLGRRAFALPQRVGSHELAAFVILPSLLPAIFGGQLGSAALTMLFNLLLLGLVWAIVGFGLFSIIRWAGRRLFSQLVASPMLLVRALPLILFFGLLAFFTTEMWQLFSTVATARLVTTGVLFSVIGLVFLSARLGDSVHEVETSVDLADRPLRRAQKVNLGLVILVSQALQILLVTGLVFAFFTVFGALLVDIEVIVVWTGRHEVLATLDLFGEKVKVTEELLKSASGIAAFSGLYYAVAMLVDPTFRDEFVAELTTEMRSTFAVRSAYLGLVRRQQDSG